MSKSQLTLLYSCQEIAAQIARLADEINCDYHDNADELLVIGVLKGSYLFVADLTRLLTIPLTLDFVRLASYGSDTQTSGIVEFRKDLELPVRGKDLLIVEDIIDSGLTLDTLYHQLSLRQPRSIKVCTLLNKTCARLGNIKPDYVGLSLDAGFVVGYGLDFDEKYRNLPDLYVMNNH